MKRLIISLIFMCIISAVHGRTYNHHYKDTTTVQTDTAENYEFEKFYRDFFAPPEIKLPAVSADSISLLSKSIGKMKKKESKSTAEHYPWKDVLDCMKEGRVFYSGEKGECGERLIVVNFTSPQWTWEKMCGRSGLLYICPVCKRQVKFDCWIMS